MYNIIYHIVDLQYDDYVTSQSTQTLKLTLLQHITVCSSCLHVHSELEEAEFDINGPSNGLSNLCITLDLLKHAMITKPDQTALMADSTKFCDLNTSSKLLLQHSYRHLKNRN